MASFDRHRCKITHPNGKRIGSSGGGGPGGDAGGSGGGGASYADLGAHPPGSWSCYSCQNVNWPRRTLCNKCKAPRPVGGTGGPPGGQYPQGAAGGGGQYPAPGGPYAQGSGGQYHQQYPQGGQYPPGAGGELYAGGQYPQSAADGLTAPPPG